MLDTTSANLPYAARIFSSDSELAQPAFEILLVLDGYKAGPGELDRLI